MTPDQKRAALILGGVAVVAALIWLGKRGTVQIPAGSDVNGAPVYDNSPPGYTTYNQPPLMLPPSINPQAKMQVPTGVGCCSQSDGCFTSSPIDTGRGPISVDQLLANYAQTDKGFFDVLNKTQAPFDLPPITIIEATNPRPDINPYWNLALSSSDRFRLGDPFSGRNYEQLG